MIRESSSSSSLNNRRPSVYEEATEMLAGALIIYDFADLRKIVRERDAAKDRSKTSTAPTLNISNLEPPMSLEFMVSKIQESGHAQQAKVHEDLKKRLEMLQSTRLACKDKDSNDTSGKSGFSSSGLILRKFEDQNANKEIVHAIVVNEARARVTVIFRGTATRKDNIQDAKCCQKKVDNPVSRLSRFATKTVEVHTGFYQYLFEVKKDKTRLQKILDEVKVQLADHPGFGLFVTGHSLGAALATLFGFYAASDDDILSAASGQSVVVYSFACPFVGNWRFRRAFRELERRKRLQHMRISNLEDMVTLLPFWAPHTPCQLFKDLNIGTLYKHCGIKLQFRGDSLPAAKDTIERSSNNSTRSQRSSIREPSFSISFHKDGTNDDEYDKELQAYLEAGKSLASACRNALRMDFYKLKNFHSCEEYEQRLAVHKAALMKITLDDLYGDRSLVGDEMNEDYQFKPQSAKERASRAFRMGLRIHQQRKKLLQGARTIS